MEESDSSSVATSSSEEADYGRTPTAHSVRSSTRGAVRSRRAPTPALAATGNVTADHPNTTGRTADNKKITPPLGGEEKPLLADVTPETTVTVGGVKAKKRIRKRPDWRRNRIKQGPAWRKNRTQKERNIGKRISIRNQIKNVTADPRHHDGATKVDHPKSNESKLKNGQERKEALSLT